MVVLTNVTMTMLAFLFVESKFCLSRIRFTFLPELQVRDRKSVV